MPSQRPARGREAEQAAEAFLVAQGLVALDRNHVVPGGEVDLVLRDGETVVFVEVRLRRSGLDDAIASVGPAKVRRILKASLHWLVQSALPDPPIRFDVVAVRPDPLSGFSFLHLPAAFDASDEAA